MFDMKATNPALPVIKELLSKNREQQKTVVEQIAELTSRRKRLDSEYEVLLQSYQIAGGEPLPNITGSKSIADMVEEILRKHGKLHVDEIRARLAEPTYNRQVDKQSIVGTLVRYIAQSKRFERVGKNTFDLSKETKGE